MNNIIQEFVNNGVYIYDADRVDRKRRSHILKKILDSGKKIHILLAPSASGKTTAAKEMGEKFITSEDDLELANEILLLSGSAMSGKGGITSVLKKQIEKVKETAGKLLYLYVPNLEIKNRKYNRAFNLGSDDVRDKKALQGSHYAPLNQFKFIKQLKDLGFKIIKDKSVIQEANIQHQFLSLEELFDTVLKFDGRDLILFDLESTGISPKKDQITQIGAAIVDGKTLKIKHEFNEKCKLVGRHVDTLFSKMSSDMMTRSAREKDGKKNDMGLLPIMMMTGYFGLSDDEMKQYHTTDDRGAFLKQKYKENTPDLTERQCIEKFMSFLQKAHNPLLIAHNIDFDSNFVSTRIGRYSKNAEISPETKELVGFSNDAIKDELETVPEDSRLSKRFRLLFRMVRNYAIDQTDDDDEQNALFDKLVNWKPIPQFENYKTEWESMDKFDTLDLVKFYFVPALRALMKVPDEKVSKVAKTLVNQMKKISKRDFKSKSVTTWNVSASLGSTAEALGVHAKGWHDAFADVVMMFEVMQSVMTYLSQNMKDISSSEEYQGIKKSMKDLKSKNVWNINQMAKIEEPKSEPLNEGRLKKIFAAGAMVVASLLAKADIDPMTLFNQIKQHEGSKSKVYKDTQGHPTIGIGFNLDAKHNQEYLRKLGIDIRELQNGAEIGEGVIKLLYNHSLTQAWHDIHDLVPNFQQLPTNVQMVLLDMSLNLGKPRLAGFKRMLAAVQQGDFQTAADEMVDSRWYHQVKSRGKDLEIMMRQGT
jgi:lysozyme